VSVNLCAVLLARTINIVIIIRRQWTTLADTTRVYVPAKMLDTCYCEDEVGANLFWFWLADSLAVQAKVLLAPALYRAYALVTRSRKLRPTFHLASWLIDDVVSQASHPPAPPRSPRSPPLPFRSLAPSSRTAVFPVPPTTRSCPRPVRPPP